MFVDYHFRFRTALNVLGDALGAGIVFHLSKKELFHQLPKGENAELNKVLEEKVILNGDEVEISGQNAIIFKKSKSLQL